MEDNCAYGSEDKRILGDQDLSFISLFHAMDLRIIGIPNSIVGLHAYDTIELALVTS